MDYRFKVEIELDDEKILAEDKYELSDIYAAIRHMFAKQDIPEVDSDSHMIVFVSTKTDDKEFAKFGLVEMSLMDSKWFRPYVKKMFWYNADDGTDYYEDIIEEDRRCRIKYGL